MLNIIIIGITIFVIISIFIFIVKRMFFLGVILAVIYVLFHLGYIWSAQDVTENLRINNLFNKETATKIEETYEGFADERSEKQVLQLKELRDSMLEDLENSVDKNELLENWKSKLTGMNVEEVEKALKETSDIWKNVFTEEEMSDPWR